MINKLRIEAELAYDEGRYVHVNAGLILALLDRLEAAENAMAEAAVEPVVTLCVKREDSKLTLQYKGEEAALDLPDGEYKLYTAPTPPAEPARTSQDVCTVPLLSDDEIDAIPFRALDVGPEASFKEFARAIEKLVRRKAGL